jgi:hypothetical protein
LFFPSHHNTSSSERIRHVFAVKHVSLIILVHPGSGCSMVGVYAPELVKICLTARFFASVISAFPRKARNTTYRVLLRKNAVRPTHRQPDAMPFYQGVLDDLKCGAFSLHDTSGPD